MSFYVVSLLLIVLLSTGNCEHENHHHHHNDDDKWTSIISQVEFLWKSSTTSPTAKDLTESHSSKEHNWSSQKAEDLTTEVTSTTFLIQNGTFIEGVKDTFRASLALLVGVPIFGVLFLCCFCYCCCKCCGLCCEDEEKGQVIVVQQNNAPVPHPPPTQIFLQQQQPVYQTPYVMQPQPQWSPPQQFQSANAAYDNPNYGAPSAPPQYAQKY